MTYNITCLDNDTTYTYQASTPYDAMCQHYYHLKKTWPQDNIIQKTKACYWLELDGKTYGIVHKKPISESEGLYAYS